MSALDSVLVALGVLALAAVLLAFGPVARDGAGVEGSPLQQQPETRAEPVRAE